MKKLITLVALLSLFATAAQAQIINLLADTLTPTNGATDCWGYVDPVSGKEYALVGHWDDIYIYDVSNPSLPVLAAHLDSIEGFDVKVYDHYLYSCKGNNDKPGYIHDISDPTNPVLVDSFPGTHNIWTHQAGYLFAAFPGLSIYSLANPESPQLIFQDTTADGHDLMVQGNILYFFGGYAGTFMYNIANPANATLIDQIVDPDTKYSHSGWPTADGKYLFVCDELAKHPTPDIVVWDISTVGNPVKVTTFSDPNAIVHNLYILDDYAYVSYYMEGMRIFDITDPTQFNQVAQFETFPDSSNENFGGCFGVYPFAPSGNIYASDMSYGLFVLNFDSLTVGIEEVNAPLNLLSAGPNPFSETTQFSLSVPEQGEVSLELMDMQGRSVKKLLDGRLLPGKYEVTWDGRNDTGQSMPAGVYFLKLGIQGEEETLRIVKQ